MNKALTSNIVEVLRNLSYITEFENLPFWFAISKELRLSNQKGYGTEFLQRFQVDEIKTNINDKLFESWEKNLANNIRKSARGIPAILIDYEESKLGGTSGEAVIQATNFYNAVTKDDRDLISNG